MRGPGATQARGWWTSSDRRASDSSLTLSSTPLTTPTAAERMGIWVPLYTSPSPEYKKLISSVEGNQCLTDSFHGTVLTGPRSGPPNVKDALEDSLYREHFDVVANTKQWTAFGYVTTEYMARPLERVLADIDAWLAPGAAGYGDQVQGIWVDNTNRWATGLAAAAAAAAGVWRRGGS